VKDALLQTKLQCPVVAPDYIPRDRLLDRLEQGRHRPLTVISASAGYGKSSLAGCWAASCDCRCGWVSLDDGDNDLHLFLAYLLATLEQAFPQIPLHTESLLEADPLPSAAELARYFLNDLDQLPEPFILFLDDYHRITDTHTHNFIAALLAHPARTMHLVLLSRTQPQLQIASLRGRGLVTEIGTVDLRFTTAEVTAFMNRMLDAPIDDATVTILETKTEGWALGLRLAGLYLQGEENPEKRSRELNGTSTHISEYYFAEVLFHRHPEMESYLRDTSILDRFCAPLCSHMHPEQEQGRPEVSADEFIEWLRENNMFVIALDDEGYWFRYHHLFRDFLKRMLEKQASADRIADLNKIAGNWFARSGLIEEAVRHLLAAEDPDAAAELIRQHRYALMNTSQFARLSRLLAALPEDILAGDAHMLTTKALLGTDVGKNIDIYAFTHKAAKCYRGYHPNQTHILN
jgi:LuxR family maltose regulon positive regulatory protein